MGHYHQPTGNFLDRPDRSPDRSVKIITLGNGTPDLDPLDKSVQSFREQHTEYVSRLASYQDQVDNHACLKAFVHRTLSAPIFKDCCPEDRDIREWYQSILSHVQQWKNASGSS